MPTRTSISIENQIDPASEEQALEELREALSESPRRIPTRLLYDQHGSHLFERITQLEEYYLTRAERVLLEEHAAEIQQITECEELVELGSGAATK
ncbi:MAG: L-histidine N(alpha)-methyltransferase, partial [Acidobacteriota bacterium]